MEMQRRVQMVFQDPVSSLSPHMTIGSILTEPLEVHAVGDRASRKQIATRPDARRGLPGNATFRAIRTAFPAASASASASPALAPLN